MTDSVIRSYVQLIGYLCISIVLYTGLEESTVYAQSTSFDAIVEEHLDDKAPGLSVAVIEKGNVVYMKGFGYADVKKKTPITPSTKFMIGSVTKQFTAMGVLILVEDGLVDLDEKVQTYLPELTPNYDAVTIRNLLTHTSGIPSDFKKRSARPFFNESLIGEDLYNALEEADLEFIPGDVMRYSNAGYSLLYMVIEAVSGVSYSDFMKANIFDPLEMTATESRDHSNSEIEGLANGYAKPKKKFQPVGSVLRLGGVVLW